MYKYNLINEKKAYQTWAKKLQEGTGIKDTSKLRTMSLLAEVKMHLDGPVNLSEKKLMESYGISTTGNILGMGPAVWGSDPGTGIGATPGAWHKPGYIKGSGDIPTMIMGMAMNVAAYCVGLDLVTTIPVDMPTVTFQFLDSVYAGGTLDKAGSAPVYVEIAADEIKNGFAWSNFAYGDIVFITPNNAGAIGAGKAIQGQFIGKSFVSGKFMLKIDSTGDILATGAYTASSNYKYSVAEVLAASNLIVKGSTNALADGTKTVISNAYADVISSIRQHIAGFSNSDGVSKDAMSREKTEAGTKNKINLRLWSKTTEMKGEEVIADITKVQLRDLKAYGVDGMAQLYKAAQNQLIQTINDQIIERMAALGVLNHAQLLNAQGVNLNLFVAPAGTASRDLVNFTGISSYVDPTGVDRRAEFGAIVNAETNSAAENTYTRQRRLYSRILAASSLIGTVGRYGKGDVAIVNSQISSALQDCKGFIAAPIENTIGKTADLHFIGTIGQVRVYENPKWGWDDTRIVVGFKGNEDTPGVKFLAYDLASSVEIIAESTMAPKISVLSRYDIIDAGFFPETQYLTIAVNTAFGYWV